MEISTVKPEGEPIETFCPKLLWGLQLLRPEWIAIPAARFDSGWAEIDLRCEGPEEGWLGFPPQQIALPRVKPPNLPPKPEKGRGRGSDRNRNPLRCLRAALMVDLLGADPLFTSNAANLAPVPSHSTRDDARDKPSKSLKDTLLIPGRALFAENGIGPWCLWPDKAPPANWWRTDRYIEALEDWTRDGWMWSHEPGDPSDLRVLPPHRPHESFAISEYLARKDAINGGAEWRAKLDLFDLEKRSEERFGRGFLSRPPWPVNSNGYSGGFGHSVFAGTTYLSECVRLCGALGVGSQRLDDRTAERPSAPFVANL